MVVERVVGAPHPEALEGAGPGVQPAEGGDCAGNVGGAVGHQHGRLRGKEGRWRLTHSWRHAAGCKWDSAWLAQHAPGAGRDSACAPAAPPLRCPAASPPCAARQPAPHPPPALPSSQAHKSGQCAGPLPAPLRSGAPTNIASCQQAVVSQVLQATQQASTAPLRCSWPADSCRRRRRCSPCPE